MPERNKNAPLWLKPVLFIGSITIAVRWVLGLRPEIHKIPVSREGEPLTIFGRRFGSHPGNGGVFLTADGKKKLDVLEWKANRIMVGLPEGVLSGKVKVVSETTLGQRSSASHSFQRRGKELPCGPYHYEVPVQAGAPWPTFRRDRRNSGRSPIQAVYSGGFPWKFTTRKGIFSTPVVDRDEVVYFGSADHTFYALNPDGTLEWKFETGEIIDSAAALGSYEAETGAWPVTFISGDGCMYHLRTGPLPNSHSRLIWKYEAELRPEVSFNRWFEGNVAIGYDGTRYAGNTNFNYYAVHPSGDLKWTFSTGSNNWSQAAFGHEGQIYWGSNDTFIRAVSPDGQELWRTRTLGIIAASAAVGSDGTVYIGSFDSYLYALNPQNGRVRWKFPTGDHIYASVALGESDNGETDAIFFGSADGYLYALNRNGTLRWKFEAGDPIRSSPVIGLGLDGEEIVYFGCGDGHLYALQAQDGSLRWAFDTTPEEPELQDRNDLNGSPALSQHGVYIGGEHGSLWHIPYDYPLHHSEDPRGRVGRAITLEDGVNLLYVTPGGTTRMHFPAKLPPATIITLRLQVRRKGEGQLARFADKNLRVVIQPEAPIKVEISADGRYLYILPEDFLEPGVNYRLAVHGTFRTGGLKFGNLRFGGQRSGSFSKYFDFSIEPLTAQQVPLKVSPDHTTAIEWTRLAAVLPSMLPSLNQIGFDYMDWILGTVAVTPPDDRHCGRFLMWAVGGRQDEKGHLVVDPNSDFTLPLSGRYRGTDIILENRNFQLAITGIQIPFRLFQLRGRLRPDLCVEPGAVSWADTWVLGIPNFGPKLVLAGLANQLYKKLLVSGTYVTRPYPQSDPANRRPAGIRVSDLDYSPPTRKRDGFLTVRFVLSTGYKYPLDQHRAGLLLVDSKSMDAVHMDYHTNLSARADEAGNLESVTLRLPRSANLAARMEVYVLLDVFPIHQECLTT